MTVAEVVKDSENELPVPLEWRQTFVEIVSALVWKDLGALEKTKHIHPISRDLVDFIAGSIESYGDRLVELSDSTWNTSIYLWMEGYWDVLVDLSTENEPSSDLVLFAKVRETDETYLFEVTSVHVP